MPNRPIAFSLSLLAALAIPVAVEAQQSSTPVWGLHRAFKVKPGKAAEFEKYFADTIRKYHQARKDAGMERMWTLNKVVIPAGLEAPYDYTSSSYSDQFPPLDQSALELSPLMEKAGTTREKLLATVGDLATLVRTMVSYRIESLGTVEPGDFVRVDYMKVAPGKGSDYVNLERTIYKPLHEARIKEGTISAWSLSAVVMPGGSERPFDYFTTNVVKTSDALGAPPRTSAVAAFAKIHPNVNYVGTMNRTQELRTIVRSYVLRAKEILR